MDSVHLTTAHSSTDVRIFKKEAVSLANAGFDVHLIAHNAPDEPMDGVSFSSLGTVSSRTDRWSNIPRATRIAKSTDASVYHFHDPELLPVGAYLSQATDSAVVYDVHEDFGRVARMRDWIPNRVGGGL